MQEFLEWLHRNEEHLRTYSTAEVSDVAIAAGMDRAAVSQWAIQQKFKGWSA